MTPQELFALAVADMEQALAEALGAANTAGDTVAIENILRLIIKKEIVLELLMDEFPQA